jgi:hypothetical protein
MVKKLIEKFYTAKSLYKEEVYSKENYNKLEVLKNIICNMDYSYSDMLNIELGKYKGIPEDIEI